MIGDPTGKSSDRPLLSPDVIAANTAGIRRCLDGLLSFESASPAATAGGPEAPPAAICVNNLDFYAGQSVLTFMRDVGVHFRVSAMLNKDSVKSRLSPPAAAAKPPPADSVAAGPAASEGLSFTEFSYQVFQGADFLRLHRDFDCWAQVREGAIEASSGQEERRRGGGGGGE
jgi:tyrosyl-tRNA synthetase